MKPEGPTSALSKNSKNKSEYDHVANTIFRYSLHRSLTDLQQFPFNSLAASRLVVSKSGISDSESFNTLQSTVDLNLAGFGSHLGCGDPIRHHTQMSGSQQSSSPSLSQLFNPQVAASKAAGKRRLGSEDDTDQNEDENGNPKKPRKSKAPSDMPRGPGLACPIQKNETEHGLKRTCHGVAAVNPSTVRRHLQDTHHIFVKLCHQCNTHILEKQEWETQHDKQPLCVPQPQVRRDHRRAQWEALYMKLYPYAYRIPSPCKYKNVYIANLNLKADSKCTGNGDDTYKLAPHRELNTEAQVDVPSTLAEDPIQLPALDDPQSLSQCQTSKAHEARQLTKNANKDYLEPALQMQMPPVTSEGDIVAQWYAQQETDANHMVFKFKEAFMELTKSKPAQIQMDLTRLVENYFHECFRDLRLSNPTEDILLTTVVFSQQRMNHEFIEEFMDVTNELLPHWKRQLAQLLYTYVRGLSDYHGHASIQPTTLQTVVQEHDSAYGSKTSDLSQVLDPFRVNNSTADHESQHNDAAFDELFSAYSEAGGFAGI